MNYELYQPQAIYEIGQRQNQEDAIYPAKGDATVENRVFVVCDGMGGHEQGEVASAAICQALSRKVEALLDASRPFTDSDLSTALQAAVQALDQADTERAGRMGTTMTFLCLHRGGCTVAHIGDSRIYHLRPQTGEVLYRSRDHSLVQQLYEMGEISYNEMATHPRKNLITKALQPYSEPVEPTVCHITDIQAGDYFYLCSDGMLEEMEDDELLSILATDDSNESKVERLLTATSENKDNHSAYLIQVKAVTREPGDENLPEDEHEARLNNKTLNDTRKDEAWAENEEDSIPQRWAETTTQMGSQATTQSSLLPPEKKNRSWIWWVLLMVIAALVGVAIVVMKNRPEKKSADKSRTELIADDQPTAPQPSAQQAVVTEDSAEPQPAARPKKSHEPDAMSMKPEEAKEVSAEENYGEPDITETSE